MGDTIAAERRKERLAKALRDNLRKRKMRAALKNDLTESGEDFSGGSRDVQEGSSCLPEAGARVEPESPEQLVGKRA